jgi:hypothetical protein
VLRTQTNERAFVSAGNKQIEFFFSELLEKMESSVISKLIVDNVDDHELIKLCADVLKNLQNNDANKKLRYYLLKNKIPADEYHLKFRSVCCVNLGNLKEWRNHDGGVHCDQIDPATGLLLPAREWENGSKAWWINNEHVSPGKDADGYSLPMFIHVSIDEQIWYISVGVRGRNEFAKDGTLLPAVIGKEKNTWIYEGKTYTKEEILAKFPPKKLITNIHISSDQITYS